MGGVRLNMFGSPIGVQCHGNTRTRLEIFLLSQCTNVVTENLSLMTISASSDVALPDVLHNKHVDEAVNKVKKKTPIRRAHVKVKAIMLFVLTVVIAG